MEIEHQQHQKSLNQLIYSLAEQSNRSFQKNISHQPKSMEQQLHHCRSSYSRTSSSNDLHGNITEPKPKRSKRCPKHSNNNHHKSSYQNQSKLEAQLIYQIKQLEPIRIAKKDLQFYLNKVQSNYVMLQDEIGSENLLRDKQWNGIEAIFKKQQSRHSQLQSNLKQIVEKKADHFTQNQFLCIQFNQLDNNLKFQKNKHESLCKTNLQLTKKDYKQIQMEKIVLQSELQVLENKLLPKLQAQQQETKLKITKRSADRKNLKQRKQQLQSKQTQILQAISDDSQKLKVLNKEISQIQQPKLIQLQKTNIDLKTYKQTKEANLANLNHKNTTLSTSIFHQQQIQTSLLEQQTSATIQIQKLGQFNSENQEQIENLSQRNTFLLQQLQKGRQFIQYLYRYKDQLRESSEVMFSELQKCCTDDEKLIRNRSLKKLQNLVVPGSGLKVSVENQYKKINNRQNGVLAPQSVTQASYQKQFNHKDFSQNLQKYLISRKGEANSLSVEKQPAKAQKVVFKSLGNSNISFKRTNDQLINKEYGI